jgi:hypothetical protein
LNNVYLSSFDIEASRHVCADMISMVRAMQIVAWFISI